MQSYWRRHSGEALDASSCLNGRVEALWRTAHLARGLEKEGEALVDLGGSPEPRL